MMGEWDKALADHNESIRLQPRWGQWYLWRGNYYLAKDDFEKAAADFDRAAELDWKESTLDKLRTLARFRLKHYDKALASIAKALELRPDDFRSFAWIPPEQLAKCPDERLRKGLLELADKTIQKTQRKADAYGARAWRGQFLKVLPLRLLRV
jgi:tetratricopeptide (TPR) repeat protein